MTQTEPLRNPDITTVTCSGIQTVNSLPICILDHSHSRFESLCKGALYSISAVAGILLTALFILPKYPIAILLSLGTCELLLAAVFVYGCVRIDRNERGYAQYLETVPLSILKQAVSSSEMPKVSRREIKKFLNKQFPGWSFRSQDSLPK